jgi:hypothetical protein
MEGLRGRGLTKGRGLPGRADGIFDPSSLASSSLSSSLSSEKTFGGAKAFLFFGLEGFVGEDGLEGRESLHGEPV